MRRFVVVALIGALVAARKQVLRALSRATGTWVGSSTP